MDTFTTAIFIEPHERHEAIEAYRSRLSDQQIEEIEDAPEGAVVRLTIKNGATTVTVAP